MKYIKYMVVGLLILSLGLGVYYYFSVLKNKKLPPVLDATPRPVTAVFNKKVITKINDYTTKLASEGEIVMTGFYQTADKENLTIDNVNYVFVIGIITNEGSLAKFHFTQEEYDALLEDKSIRIPSFFVRESVKVTVYPNKINITPYY